MTVRLPTIGAAAPPRDAHPSPARSLRDRFDPPGPLVAIGGAVVTAPALEFALRLVKGLRGRNVPVGAVVVGRGSLEAFEREGFVAGSAPARLRDGGADPVGRLDAPADRMEIALAQAFEQLAPSDHRLLVSVGNEVPGLYRTTLTVLLTAGVAPPGWSASARALRDRIDLQLADPRDGVAAGLAAALAARQ